MTLGCGCAVWMGWPGARVFIAARRCVCCVWRALVHVAAAVHEPMAPAALAQDETATHDPPKGG